MFSWDAPCNSFACWWWIIPLVLIALCMIMCITCRRHRAGRRWCCGRRHRPDDLDELRKDVQALKERVGSIK